ncbi:hypothetical protein [Streptomyces sp. NPDC001307]|uniref:hypothetical protein n=1 Tax=Streptomyces sp. NPDC001307 TaxID=3364560 RepID=UPI0036A8CD94
MAAANLFRTPGGSTGVAVFGSLFTRALPAMATAGLPHGSDARHIFVAAAGVCAVAFVPALPVVGVPLRGRTGAAQKNQPVTRLATKSPADR